MSIRVMADVWDNGPDDATLTNVLIVLANSADDSGGNCFPGNALIAQRTRYSERTVIRAIAELEREGWITVVQRRGGRPRRGAKRHELAEYHTQYLVNVQRLRNQKGCHSVMVSDRAERVTTATGKGDTGAGKGDKYDNPPDPLFGRSVSEPSGYPSPQPPSAVAPGGDAIDRAADQVCSALAIVRPRTKRMLRKAIELQAEKGDVPATIALEMIAAVREQAATFDRGLLTAQFGPEKFIGLGIWKDKRRWCWNQQRLDLMAGASVGTYKPQ